jgi:hypothetical protein
MGIKIKILISILVGVSEDWLFWEIGLRGDGRVRFGG